MTEPGWRLGNRYLVVDRIGAGGMAEVFRAHDDLLNRDVAVKVFRAVPSTPDTASGVERQRAELHALARLNHPNLITLFDGSVTDRPAYLVMELIEGPSLAERIQAGPVAEPEAREIAVQIGEALAYVHSQGMVHRDIKPANILLGADRSDDATTLRARLSDFGIVRLLGTESMTSIEATLGTASYLAPEQTRGSAVGPPADIYALGLTLIETFTGAKSFDGPPIEAAMARLTRDPAIPTQLPAPWPALLHAMTARDPAARPSATRVARALRGDLTAATAALSTARPMPDSTALLGRAVPAYAAAPPVAPLSPSYPTGGYPPVRPEPRGGRGWIVALAVVVVALLAGGIILLVSNASGGGGSPSNSPTPSHPTTKHKRSTSTSQPETRAPSTPPSTRTSKSRTKSSSKPPSSNSPPPSSSTPPKTSSAPSTRSSTSKSQSSSASTSTPPPDNGDAP